jgi:murein DD-endopeptidase MepM/ murein hydrolase activator NlpD
MRAGAILWVAIGLTALAGCTTSTPAPPPPKTTPGPPPAAPRPAKPAWQMKKVVPDAVAVPGGRLHTVKPGETGLAIAAAYGVPWSQIVAANKLKAPYVLEVGQKLLLPSKTQLAQMSIEQRAKAFDLNIDDIITGSAPAAPAPKAAPAKPGAAPKPTPPPGVAGTGPAPPFSWPVEGRILSGFGPKPGGRFNDGVNLKASQGAAVRSAGDGTVAYAGDAIPGFGNLILITHANGYVTAYGHNEALLVARGKKVTRGDVIARAGMTGAVTEPQVHFEIRRNRTPVDPVKVIGGR